MTFFAHAGHDHAEQETTAASAISPDITIGVSVLLCMVAFWVLATYALKIKLAHRILLIMTGLLGVGVTMYEIAPVVSTVALATGFALALIGVLVQIVTSRPQAEKE